MSRQQQSFSHTVQRPALEGIKQSAEAHRQSDLALDLVIMEAGLRLKILPLRDAAVRGHQLRFSEAERRLRQHAVFDLNGTGPLRIIDIGMFADAVARRPELAQRLADALRAGQRR